MTTAPSGTKAAAAGLSAGAADAAASAAPRAGWAAALSALPETLRILPFHPASQLVHLLPADRVQRQPWRILEILDTPQDQPLFARVGEALDVATHAALSRSALFDPATAGAPTSAAEPFNLVYVHPGCDSRAEFRRLLAALEPRFAPNGLLWVQAIDPVFTPAQLPPPGRTLPALSALLAELDPSRWQCALRSQRAIFTPELLIHRALPAATARWHDSLVHFTRGFPHQAFPPEAWNCLGAARGPLASAAPTVAQAVNRDGLDQPRQDAAGRWFRPVLTAASRVAVTIQSAPGPLQVLRVTVDANPEAGPLILDWLGAPAYRLPAQEPSAKDLPPGRHVQHWTVCTHGRDGTQPLAHAVLRAPRFTHLYSLQIEPLAEAATLDPAHLPRDMVARHQAAAAIFSPAPASLAILDVGGAPGLLAALLSNHRVTIVDTAHAAEHPDFLRLAAQPAPPAVAALAPLHLPFGDAAFDGVVAIDVLEHIPPAHRAAFVAECARVAKSTLLIACPVDSPAARAAEAALAAALVSQGDRGSQAGGAVVHEFLDDHRRFGLPAQADIERWFANAGRAVTSVTPGATVAEWLQSTAADLGLHSNGIPVVSAGEAPYRCNILWTAF